MAAEGRMMTGKKIEEMFCFAVEEEDGGEGVPAVARADGMVMPLMGADYARVESLRPFAQRIANETGKTMRIYRFSCKEVLGEVVPESPSSASAGRRPAK